MPDILWKAAVGLAAATSWGARRPALGTIQGRNLPPVALGHHGSRHDFDFIVNEEYFGDALYGRP